MIFESHAHYDDEAFDEDREELLTSMQENGIEYIINVCAAADELDKTIALTEKYPFIFGAVGVHPDDAGKMNDEILNKIKELCQLDKVVAVGEIGLDYYWDKEDHSIQKEWFVRQLRMAKELKLPVIIHSREAAADTFEILKQEKTSECSMVMHCYSYSSEMAKEYLKMGFYLGIGGVLTFKNGKKLKETVAEAPMEQLLLETDCPYLAPVPYRGKRNDSRKLVLVAEELGRIKGISADEVIRITEENARRFFRLEQEERL